MHAVFIPYGLESRISYFLKEFQHQKFQLKLTKKGEEDKFIWIQGHLRVMPFGLYEFIFPRESMDLILTTLQFNNKSVISYGLDKEIKILGIKIKPLDYLKKFLKIEDIPKFNEEKKLIWIMDDVAIIPIGIKKDVNLTEPNGEYEGWTHEAI